VRAHGANVFDVLPRLDLEFDLVVSRRNRGGRALDEQRRRGLNAERDPGGNTSARAAEQ